MLLNPFFEKSNAEIKKMVEPTKEEVMFIVEYINNYNNMKFEDFIKYAERFDLKEYDLYCKKINYYNDPLQLKPNERDDIDKMIIKYYDYYNEFKNVFEEIWKKYVKYSVQNKDKDKFASSIFKKAFYYKGFGE